MRKLVAGLAVGMLFMGACGGGDKKDDAKSADTTLAADGGLTDTTAAPASNDDATPGSVCSKVSLADVNSKLKLGAPDASEGDPVAPLDAETKAAYESEGASDVDGCGYRSAKGGYTGITTGAFSAGSAGVDEFHKAIEKNKSSGYAVESIAGLGDEAVFGTIVYENETGAAVLLARKGSRFVSVVVINLDPGVEKTVKSGLKDLADRFI